MITRVKIELEFDELLVIMFCLRTAILTGQRANLATLLYDRLDKIVSGV